MTDDRSAPRDWPLVLRDGCLRVLGLPTWMGDPDTILIVRYASGDVDTVSEDGENLHHALYDLYQTSDGLRDGDTFSVDGRIMYRCEGFHVVPPETSTCE